MTMMILLTLQFMENKDNLRPKISNCEILSKTKRQSNSSKRKRLKLNFDEKNENFKEKKESEKLKN